MEANQELSLEQIRAFLKASDAVGFEGRNREEVYGWVNRVLDQQGYSQLNRRGRGLVRRYVEKMTGLSRAQTTRLISRYLRGEPVRMKATRRHRFATRYGLADISLLAAVGGARGAQRAGDAEDNLPIHGRSVRPKKQF